MLGGAVPSDFSRGRPRVVADGFAAPSPLHASVVIACGLLLVLLPVMRRGLLCLAILLVAGCQGAQPTGGVGTWGAGDRERDPYYRPADDPQSPYYDPLRRGGIGGVR